MPKRIEWTEVQDLKIRRMRAESASWDSIAEAVGVTRWTAIERGRRLGARLPPPDFQPPPRTPTAPLFRQVILRPGGSSTEECPWRVFRTPYRLPCAEMHQLPLERP